MKRPSYAFWRGALSMGCLHSLVQDALGQEWVADPRNWIDARITVPLAFLGLLICWGSYEGEQYLRSTGEEDEG